ncbi:hypothetical protein EOW65_17105 [Sinirhodobacter ferrireducens]|uniref:Uncharacterized protein n=1 Tax=Paenirhodobacter ferrireducens TaxID=1215032 RepID=A0A443L763_9RHOB|nr:hypothetical protein [Sinirhodobacter ferrireducens]RWR45067.1 hypothetical protein EOW65_17105 [Sinirhodobacter ferrireducens]
MNDIDVTGRISLFREAARHAWNTYFARQNFGECLELYPVFKRIEAGFFEAIVLQPLGMMELSSQFGAGPLDWLLMVPKEGMRHIPARFEKNQADGNTYWGDIKLLPVDDGRAFLFVEFYDWDWCGYIDMSHARVQLRAQTETDHLKSSFALLDTDSFRFVFRPCSE